eukprot:4756289-Alexandrium_andersonii.AAC.1
MAHLTSARAIVSRASVVASRTRALLALGGAQVVPGQRRWRAWGKEVHGLAQVENRKSGAM